MWTLAFHPFGITPRFCYVLTVSFHFFITSRTLFWAAKLVSNQPSFFIKQNVLYYMIFFYPMEKLTGHTSILKPCTLAILCAHRRLRDAMRWHLPWLTRPVKPPQRIWVTCLAASASCQVAQNNVLPSIWPEVHCQGMGRAWYVEKSLWCCSLREPLSLTQRLRDWSTGRLQQGTDDNS